MHYPMQKKIIILLVLLISVISPVKSQYNPYLDKKRKNKPSVIMAKENKKTLKHQKKAAKKQMRRSRKKVKGAR